MARAFPIVFLLALLIHGTGFAQTKIKAAYGAPSLSVIMIQFGAQAGTFARYGLSMEAVYIAGRSINALLAGDVQFGFIGGPQVILARMSGADVLVIGKKVGIGVFGTVAVENHRMHRARGHRPQARRNISHLNKGHVLIGPQVELLQSTACRNPPFTKPCRWRSNAPAIWVCLLRARL
ncbi:MAG: hypothetical protein ACREP3_16810 [Candidatus Binatia bacterium]